METGSPDGQRPQWAWACAFVAALTALRLACAAALPLLTAETYYWLWSRELAWSYFDHPPAVAVAIATFSPWLGDSPLGVRLAHVLFAAIGSLAFYRLCLDLVAPRAAFACLLVLGFAPVWLPFGIFATPDGPLLLFWTLAIWLFHRAWRFDSLGAWLLAGAATGLAILSKYNGFLLLPAFLAFLVLNERGRGQLRGAGPWLAVVLALALAAPNLVLDASQGGDTLATPLRGRIDPTGALRHLGVLALLPAGLLTPLIAVAWAWQSWIGVRRGRLRTDSSFQLAFCTSWLPFGCFVPVAMMSRIHAQWIACCLITALPVALENLGRRGEGASPRFLRTAMASGAALVITLVAIVVVALATVQPDVSGEPRGLARLALELRGPGPLGERLEAELDRLEGQDFFLASMNYHLTSFLEWRTRGRVESHSLDPARSHQYLNRRPASEFVGRNALFADKRNMSREDRRDLRRVFRRVEPLKPVTVRIHGVDVEWFQLYWCENFLGWEARGAGRKEREPVGRESP